MTCCPVHCNETCLIKSRSSRTSNRRSDLILGRESGMGARWVQLKLRHGVTADHACRISLSDATEKLIIMEVVSSVGGVGTWVDPFGV
jgi:hypothetical protein